MPHLVTALKTLVKKAFRRLARRGLITRMNFKCCMGCALEAFRSLVIKYPEKVGVVYYHRQDHERMVNTGRLDIRYSDVGGDVSNVAVGRMIIEELTKEDLVTDWDGNPDHVIEVWLA